MEPEKKEDHRYLGTMEPLFSKLDYDSISLSWWSYELDTSEKNLIKYSSTFKDVKKLSLSPFGLLSWSPQVTFLRDEGHGRHGPRAPSPSVNSRPKAEAVRSAMSCDAGNFASRYDSHVMWYIHMMYVCIYIYITMVAIILLLLSLMIVTIIVVPSVIVTVFNITMTINITIGMIVVAVVIVVVTYYYYIYHDHYCYCGCYSWLLSLLDSISIVIMFIVVVTVVITINIISIINIITVLSLLSLFVLLLLLLCYYHYCNHYSCYCWPYSSPFAHSLRGLQHSLPGFRIRGVAVRVVAPLARVVVSTLIILQLSNFAGDTWYPVSGIMEFWTHPIQSEFLPQKDIDWLRFAQICNFAENQKIPCNLGAV